MVPARRNIPEIIHQLPGRLRVDLPGLPDDPRQMGDLVTEIRNIEGVEKATVNTVSGRALIIYDQKIIKAAKLVDRLQIILASAAGRGKQGAPARQPAQKNAVSGDCRASGPVRRHRVKLLLTVGAAGIIGLKRVLWGPSLLALSPGLFYAATVTSVISGYPTLRRKAGVFLSRAGADENNVLTGSSEVLALARESVPGLASAATEKLIQLDEARISAGRAAATGGTGVAAEPLSSSGDSSAAINRYMSGMEKTVAGLAATLALFGRSWERGLAVILAGSPGTARLVEPAVNAAVARRALESGLIIANYPAFSRLAGCEQLLFSSGELLRASVSIGELYVAPGYRRKEISSIIAAIVATIPAGPDKKPDLAGFILADNHNGIMLELNGEEFRLVRDASVISTNVSKWARNKMSRLGHLRQSPLLLFKGEKLCAVTGIQYSADPETERVLYGLKAQGLSLAVFGRTEDHEAGILSRLYAIDTVYPVSFPQDKLNTLIELQRRGIKSALLLTENDDAQEYKEKAVTITTNKNQTGAGLILTGNGLSGLVEAFHLAHAHQSKMQQGILTLRVLNSIGLALAAAGRIGAQGAALFSNLTRLAVGLLARRLPAVRGAQEPGDSPDSPGGGKEPAAPGTGRPRLSLVDKSVPATQSEWARLSIGSVLQLLQTDMHRGLEHGETQLRLARFGNNRLEETKPPSLFKRFIGQLNNVLVQTLLGSTVVCVLLGELGDALAIIAIVLLNALFGMLQEQKADQSLAALKKMSAPAAKVIRDGVSQAVPAVQLVPGDIVILEQGDIIPADLRLLEVVRLEVDEAALTGESYPVHKQIQPQAGCLYLQDCHNMAFSGTVVTRGRGVGAVVATGMNSEIGKIAGYLGEESNADTPLQKRLENISGAVLRGCLLASGIFVAAGVTMGHGALGMFLTGVSLAVAAIPEGLPATVTVALAASVRRMAAKNAVVRRLPGIETLGNTTVICCDKTGTLTKNELTVQAVYCSGRLCQAGGNGFVHPDETMQDGDLAAVLTAGVMCNDASLRREKENKGQTRWSVAGDPMEGAILVAASKAKIDYNIARKQQPRLAELPFDPERGYMTTVNDGADDYMYVYTKGALEKVLKLCSSVLVNGREIPLNEHWRNNIMACNEQLTRDSLRVLALARRRLARNKDIRVEEMEQEMVFLGLLGLIDPLRPEVAEAVAVCRKAGIKVCMITGDHGNTARAIGAQLGLENHHRVITGYELDNLSDDDLASVISKAGIFARVLPRHKLRLVKAFRAQGEVVTMIGDGVNDAPAVKEADVGVAMGNTGTDVTKQASVIIITDDNFATLVKAIKQGRGIYNNIRKSVAYQLATNAGEVIMMILAVLLGMPLPLLPIQLLWLNLLGDGLPALALGIDKPAPGLMEKAPEPRSASFFAEGLGSKIISRGAAIGLTSTVAYGLVLKMLGGLGPARTVALATLTLSQFLYALSCRRDNPPAHIKPVQANRYLNSSLVASTVLLITTIYLPAGRTVFKTVPLAAPHWAVVTGGTLFSAALDNAISKLFRKSGSAQTGVVTKSAAGEGAGEVRLNIISGANPGQTRAEPLATPSMA